MERHDRPRWAPRVSHRLIRELYEKNAAGIYDEDLADEVGYAFLARADSLVQTNRAHYDHVVNCPVCGAMASYVNHILCCDCGWSLSWREYHATYQKKQLIGENIPPLVEVYIREFGAARDYHAKMRAIDNLLHRFHWELQNAPTRPLAVNFIDLRLWDVVRFLITLAYPPDDPEARRQYETWLANARKSGWYENELAEFENLPEATFESLPAEKDNARS